MSEAKKNKPTMDISAYQQLNIRMSSRGKRPLRNLTPSDKVRAIQRIHNGETKASVSRDIGVPESTLRGWCKNEQKLRFMTRQLGSDQGPLVGMENPPEKRIKYDCGPSKIGNMSNIEDYNYNRLLLNGIELPVSNNSSSSSNSFLEKIAFAEFIKKNCHSNALINKPSNGGQHFSTMIPTLPASRDLSQISLVQNLNYLSLLNKNVTKSSESITGNNPPQNSPKALNATKYEEYADNYKQFANTLSVKDWAKEPLGNVSAQINANTNINSDGAINDSNNNDVDAVNFLANFTQFFAPLMNPNATADENNAAMLEWCKMFNASLSFLAMAAAAASVNAPQLLPVDDDEKTSPAQFSNPFENLILQQMAKATNNQFNYSDGYFDSEPEDLSIRSTTSTKPSSPTNSRSESPESFESNTYSDSDR